MTGQTIDRPGAWADLLAVLSECLREPDEQLVVAVERGEVGDALADAARALDLRPAAGTDPPALPSVGAATESYLALFEAMETPYAPNAESPYRPWYGNRSGLMGGPPAEDMARRYAAADAEFPAGYPPDHVALLLEYGALLLDARADEAFVTYAGDHFEWFPSLRLATEGAAADAPFHRWAVRLLDDVTIALRSRVGLDAVDEATAREMVERVGDAEVVGARV